jgi:putative toxin-antitoxin system antitoxin component (TIGR02293 family)
MAAPSSLSTILGLDQIGPLPLISAVENGLPLAALDRLMQSLAPPETGFATRIVARATLARRRRALATAIKPEEGRLSAEEGSRLARLAAVWAMAIEVWGSEDAARRFMFTPHPMLHARRPVDIVLQNELGRPVVEGILGRLQYSAAV